MFAGHVGAALAIGRAERRVNVGLFVLAALLLDVVLWTLVLFGREAVVIPADFARTHLPAYDFPFSHGLLAGAAWSALAGVVAYALGRRFAPTRARVASLTAAAVFSHWLLDALVHAPEMPLAGARSVMLGLGLGRDAPVAIAVEVAIAAAGLALFVAGTRLSRARTASIATLTLLVAAFTVVGMTLAPAPPSASAMAGSSLITILVVSALTLWFGRLPGSPRA